MASNYVLYGEPLDTPEALVGVREPCPGDDPLSQSPDSALLGALPTVSPPPWPQPGVPHYRRPLRRGGGGDAGRSALTNVRGPIPQILASLGDWRDAVRRHLACRLPRYIGEISYASMTLFREG
jgi:hypothetical protein